MRAQRTALPEPTFVFPLPDGLDTPVPVLDLDIMNTNITRMADALAARGVALRPHFKTARMIEVARRQILAGAVGMTCATITEAEVLADAGIDDIFVAYPTWLSDVKAARLSTVLGHARRVSVGLDCAQSARRLADAFRDDALKPDVLLEIDSGDRRTGITPTEAGSLATEVASCGLNVLGVFTHGGHGYEPGCTSQAGDDEVLSLERAAASLQQRGITPKIVSAGSTPTVLRSARGMVTEERPGTYVFGDRQQVALGSCNPLDVAVVVAATVVSTAVAGQFVVDAGAKSLAKDRPSWLSGFGYLPAYPKAVITRIFDHHAVCELPSSEARPRIGDVVAVVPNHICPVINLASHVVVISQGRKVGQWNVVAHA